jgi:hypothetical protein
MEEFANSGALSFSGLFIFVRKKLLSKFHETLPIFLNKADLHGGAELSSLEAEVPWEYHPLLYPLGLAGRLLVRSVYPGLWGNYFILPSPGMIFRLIPKNTLLSKIAARCNED